MAVDNVRSWIILGACFCLNMIIDGMGLLGGIYFVASMEKFHVDRAAASFPYTFCSFVKCVAGPLYGYLGHKFGIQNILIIGSLLSSFGLGACYFVENIGLITLFFGVIHGLGSGAFLLLPVLINQYFDKYRAIASGLRITGKSIGSFILPAVTETLLEKYGLSETYLILSGVILICLPITLLLKTLMKSDLKSGKQSIPATFSCADTEKQPLLQDVKAIKVYSEQTSMQKHFTASQEEEHLKQKLSRRCPDVDNKSDESATIENSLTPRENLDEYQSPDCQIEKHNKENCYWSDKDDKNIEDVPKHFKKSRRSLRTNSSNVTDKVTFLSVITNPVFICLTLETVFYGFATTCLVTIIVDFAKDIGLSEQEQGYTVMAISVGLLIGPLALGWLVDKSYVKKTTFLSIICLLQALTNVAMPFSNGSIMLLSLLATSGCLFSVETFVLPLLVPEYMSESKQTIAIPSVPFLAAPFALLISPLIGFMREGLGSYEYMFYIIGILIALSSIIFLVIPCLSKSKKKSKSLKS